MGTGNMKATPQHTGTMLLALLIAVASSTSLVSYFITVAGFRELPFAQQVVIDSLSWVEIGLTLFVNIAIFTGAVWLFLLRRAALHSFLSAFGASIAKFIWAAFDGFSGEVFTWGSGGELMLIGFVLVLSVYTWRLDRSGGVLH